MKTQLSFIFSFLFFLNLHSQIIETDNLFEFYTGQYQKNIRISKKIQDHWNLPNYFLQHTHYNANIDRAIDSAGLIKQVLYIYKKKNSSRLNILELIDDGNHFDNEPNDGIYGNYLSGDFSEFQTNEATIDIQLDTLGINYHIIQPPVNYLPEVPIIIAPGHKTVISSDKLEIYWEIDPKADGCGAILLGSTPILGEELEDIIWGKKYQSNKNELYSEIIPIPLINDKAYTLIIWSYTNTNTVDLNQGAYSIDWCQFFVDSLQDKKENFVLSHNFPNPFNTRTIIKYNLSESGKVSIKIINLLGQEIITLINREQSEGEHYIRWNGKNNFGEIVTSGVYFCNINFKGKSISRKILFAR